MKRVFFAIERSLLPTVIGESDLTRLRACCRVIDVPAPQHVDKAFLLKYIADAQIIVTCWGTASIDADVLRAAPKLELLVHAAGTVKGLAMPEVWARGVRVVSAAAAIAPGVAEFTIASILLAAKRTLFTAPAMREGRWRDAVRAFGGPFELYQQRVGVIGAGHIGRLVIRGLKQFTDDILLFDPYVTDAHARELGATKAKSLDAIFSTCRVVTLHAPVTDQTRRMIRGRHFRLLPRGAVFVNTARAAVVDEAEMCEELAKGTFVACLDMTADEPPPADYALRHLPNVCLTPHVAGCIADNQKRLGTLAVDEIEAYVRGQTLSHEVKEADLGKIA